MSVYELRGGHKSFIYQSVMELNVFGGDIIDPPTVLISEKYNYIKSTTSATGGIAIFGGSGYGIFDVGDAAHIETSGRNNSFILHTNWTGSGNFFIVAGRDNCSIDVGNFFNSDLSLSVKLAGTHNSVQAFGVSASISGGSGYGEFSIGGFAFANVGSWLDTGGFYNTINFSGAYGFIQPGDGLDKVYINNYDLSYGTFSNPRGVISVDLERFGNYIYSDSQGSLTNITGGLGGGQFYLYQNARVKTSGYENVFHCVAPLEGQLISIDAGSGHDSVYVDYGNADITLHGAANHLYLADTANVVLHDDSSASFIYIYQGSQKVEIYNFGAERRAVIDGHWIPSFIHLDSHASGFSNTSQIIDALEQDGAGGLILKYGNTEIDFYGTSTLKPYNFEIG